MTFFSLLPREFWWSTLYYRVRQTVREFTSGSGKEATLFYFRTRCIQILNVWNSNEDVFTAEKPLSVIQ